MAKSPVIESIQHCYGTPVELAAPAVAGDRRRVLSGSGYEGESRALCDLAWAFALNKPEPISRCRGIVRDKHYDSYASRDRLVFRYLKDNPYHRFRHDGTAWVNTGTAESLEEALDWLLED